MRIVMLPVKEMGCVRSFVVKMLNRTLGWSAALGWCMHWAIIVAESSCFELQRFPARPYTRLKASMWDGSRTADLIYQMYVGRTSWTDEQIEDLGEPPSPKLGPFSLLFEFWTHLDISFC